MYRPTEHLMMDMSERHPVFLYASSQNDFIHQRLPEHHVVPPNLSRPHQRQRQNGVSKPKFVNSPTPVQRENKPRNSPQLTYGFQPKPSTNRHVSHQVQKKNPQTNQQNEGFRTRRPPKPIQQTTMRHETQQTHNQRQQFTEHISAQSSVHQKQQNDNTVSSPNHQNGFGDFSQPFNYHSHILTPERQFISTTRPNRNNQLHQNTGGENRKPISNNQRVNKPSKENGQESDRKRVTFEGAAQAFKSRLNSNNQAADGTFPPKVFNNYNRQNSPERNQNNNERIIMQDYARSMRENMPQLPPRPPFNNGGIKINTLAGELPVLHLDSINTLSENPTVYLQTNNRHEYAPIEEQEKKTYLLIKAPSSVTTERPSSESFVRTSNKYTSSPPYMINDYRETSPSLPDITHSTLPEPHEIPETAQTPAIVLDLVQIPDHALINHEEHSLAPQQQSDFRSVDHQYKNEGSFQSTKNYQHPEFRPVDNKYKNEESLHLIKNYQQPEFRSVDNKYKNEENLHSTRSYQNSDEFRSTDNKYKNEESFRPTESYPTTPMQSYEDAIHHKKKDYTSAPEYYNNAYYSHPKDRTYSTLSAENSLKYQNKFTPKPKIKELLKSSNFSSLPPISYSSSVSVVSVKHNVDTRPSPPKKQKTTVKKALSSKKKAKIPENEHISYDDYDDGEGVPGDPGIDYPTYKDIPLTNFECKNEKSPGFYADTETGCQVRNQFE